MWLFFYLRKKNSVPTCLFSLSHYSKSACAHWHFPDWEWAKAKKKCNNKIESIFVLAIKIPDTIANRNSNWKAKAKILQEILFNQKRKKRYFLWMSLIKFLLHEVELPSKGQKFWNIIMKDQLLVSATRGR